MGLISALRPSKSTGRRHSSNDNNHSLSINVGGDGGDKTKEINDVFDVSYLHEIYDQNILLAVEKLRHTKATRSKSAAIISKTSSKGNNRRPLTPPRNPPRNIFPAPPGAGADILLGTIYSSESPTGMSLADSSVSSNSDSDESADKRKSTRPRPVPNVADDHNKSTADANINTNSRIPIRIPESFRNMTRNLPSNWERMRSLVTRLSSEMNCLGEENTVSFEKETVENNVTLEETVARYGVVTFEGMNTFDETLTTFDDTLVSSFIDGIYNTSIEHVPRQNNSNNNHNYHNKGYDYDYADTDPDPDFMFDIDQNQDDNDADHPNIRSPIFGGSTTVDEYTHLSSLLKASTISYEAASDDLVNDNNIHVHIHHHDHHQNDKDWENEEENNNILTTRNKKDYNQRSSPSSPLMTPVSLELELGLNSDSDGIDDNGIPRSFIVIPTTTSAARHNRPLEEDDDDDDDTTRDFPFDDNDAVSLLTTDIALMTGLVPLLIPSSSPSKKTILRSSSLPSKLPSARPPSCFNNINNSNIRMISSSATPLSHSLSRSSRSKAAAAAAAPSSAVAATSRSSITKKNKFWRRFLVYK